MLRNKRYFKRDKNNSPTPGVTFKLHPHITYFKKRRITYRKWHEKFFLVITKKESAAEEIKRANYSFALENK